MSLVEFLQSCDLAHLNAKLKLAGYADIGSLRLLAQNEDTLDALELTSRDAKRLVAAIWEHPFQSRLPTVLALPLREFEREQNPVLALWAMCDLVELTHKLCVMAAAAEHTVLPEPLVRVFYERIERPTLGGWHEMARIAVGNLPVDTLLPELPGTFQALQKLISTESDGPTSSVLCVRNRLAHGRPTRFEAAQWIAAWRQPMARFVQETLAWLEQMRFVAVDGQGNRYLLRGETAAEIQENTPVPDGAPAGSAWLCVGTHSLALGFLAAFDPENRAPLVYMRSQNICLQYLRIAEAGGAWESNIQTLKAFRERFINVPPQADSRGIRSFDEEIFRESERRIGRERELQHLWDAVVKLQPSERGCLWVGGPAGIGKSNLMASLMQRLREDTPENTLFLPYRFRARDDRNNRSAFLIYLREQLERSGCLQVPEHTEGDDAEKASYQPSSLTAYTDLMNEVRGLLGRLQKQKHLLLVVDGLDEIVEQDTLFVEEILLRLIQERVVVVGAGRPEFGIPESFRKKKAREPFPHGLATMSEDDVRAMLLENLFGTSRRGILESDQETGGNVTNMFISRVAKRSEGLPIYVNYVIGDIFARKIRPDNSEELPRGLAAYHTELLRRRSVGDLQTVTPPTLVLLALAGEPLYPEVIAALLKRFGRLNTVNVPLVEQGLNVLGSMLRRTTHPDGGNGVMLYHHSLRTHILGDPDLAETVATTKKAFADAAIQPGGDVAERYLYRNGVRHLLETQRVTDAVSIITDFDLLMTRFRVLDETGQAPQGWYSDWELLREKGRFTGDTRIWWDFARTNRHHFQKVGWESWRVLFQAAMDHADDSPVTIAAESFYARGKAGWTWLQYVNRPKKWVPNPLVAVMAGHTGDITGLQSLPNGLVVSSSADSTLRLWDPARGSCVAVLCGHQGGVGGMKVSEDGRILSWAEDGTLRLWDGLTGASVASLGGHSKSIDGAAFLSEGRVLSWSSDGDLRIWTKNGSCAHILRGNGRNVKGACSLSDNGVAAWSWDPFSKRSNKLCIWNTKTGKRVHLLKGHQSGVYGAAELSVGQIVSWCHDIRLWDRKSGECLMEFTGHSEAVSGVIDISNDRMLSWSNDTTIRIWDKKSGNCVKVFKGHEGNIEGVWLDANQKMLSWDDDGLICLWELETGGCVGVFQTKESEFNEKVVLPTGKLLSVAGRCIDLWRLEGINISKKPVGHRREISGALVVNEKQILSYAPDGLFCFWKTESGEFIRSLDAHRKDAFFNYYRCIHGVSLHPNGNLLSVAFSGTLKFWNTSIRKSLVVIDGGTGVNFLILPNGDVVSWNCEDNFLRIWSGENGECLKVLKGHRSFVRDVDVISGDRIVSYSWDGTIRIWNQKSGKCVKVLHEHRKFNARSSADLTELGYGGIFTLNSGRFLSWCGDGNARFWDVSGVPRMVSLNGHSDAIVGAEEMPEGRILTFSDDKTLRLWDRISGECIALMTGHTAEVWGAEALDDGRIVSWSGDGTLRVWEPAFSRCLAIIRSPIDWQNDREEISAARPKSLIRHHALDFDINIHDCNYNAANEVLTAVCSRGLCLRIYNLIDY